VVNYPPPRPKFQHNYTRHLLFFGLTFFTTTFREACAYWLISIVAWWQTGTLASPLAPFTWPLFLQGLSYSVPLLIILGAHEFGHYFACRYHNVDATLPFFIPAPVPLTGTFGAVIRIREAFPSKKALFDIGVAGPIAGFVALLPFLIWGMKLSTVAPSESGAIYFGEPLLWKLAEFLYFGVLHIGVVPPGGLDVALHPMGFAAWWGMLATALNLLPFGQLDGGHIMYAAVGRRATWLSALTLVVVVSLALLSASWFMTAALMAGMAIFFGFRHPHVVDEHEPLDPTRRLVAICAVIIFILCFTPVPIEITGQ
jgi:membrane-associated protease RseP (regulator of RpoE activity)